MAPRSSITLSSSLTLHLAHLPLYKVFTDVDLLAMLGAVTGGAVNGSGAGVGGEVVGGVVVVLEGVAAVAVVTDTRHTAASSTGTLFL